MKNDKCVYLHKDKLGVVRYVGHGNSARPYVRSKMHRNKQWHELFSNEDPDIEIAASNLNYNQAVELEQILYREHILTVVNTRLPNKTKELDFAIFNDWFQIDNSSPSGLIWKRKPKRSKYQMGDQAGSLLTKEYGNQYWQIRLNFSVYKVHRIVYLLQHGEISSNSVIDHIDGNGLNNCVSNLRLSDATKNCHNRKTSRNNKLQHKNISLYEKGYKSFRVCIMRGSKNHTKAFCTADYESQDQALSMAIEWRDTKLKELDGNKE